MSPFLKTWSLDHLHGVRVKNSDSRAPFQATCIKTQGWGFRDECSAGTLDYSEHIVVGNHYSGEWTKR
jgi:hypothetical protein